MKQFLLIISLVAANFAKAQNIDSIYVNLYTDSLKKGTFNYINIDGRLSNGRYLPLDDNDLTFTTSAGEFKGNSLWINKDCKEDKVSIKVILKSNLLLHKEFDIYIKQLPDNEKLKTKEEILNEMKKSKKNTNKR